MMCFGLAMMVAHAYHLGTWKADAGLRVKDSAGCRVRLCLQPTKESAGYRVRLCLQPTKPTFLERSKNRAFQG